MEGKQVVLALVRSSKKNGETIGVLDKRIQAVFEALKQVTESIKQDLKTSAEALRSELEGIREENTTNLTDVSSKVQEISIKLDEVLDNAEEARVQEVPTQDEEEDSSKIKGLSFKGPWKGGEAYVKGDVVEFDGSSYVALVDNQGKNPGSPNSKSIWQVLARAGRDGGGAPSLNLAMGIPVYAQPNEPTVPNGVTKYFWFRTDPNTGEVLQPIYRDCS